jgi:hypothetical protein
MAGVTVSQPRVAFLFGSAETESSRQSGGPLTPFRHTAIQIFFDREIDMGTQLLIEILIRPSSVKERRTPAQQLPCQIHIWPTDPAILGLHSRTHHSMKNAARGSAHALLPWDTCTRTRVRFFSGGQTREQRYAWHSLEAKQPQPFTPRAS